MIYTPRAVITLLCSDTGKSLKNKQTCTKIDYRGFEISIAMDSSGRDGDLFRSDIRVFSKDDGKDVTERFLEPGEEMIYGSAEALRRVLNMIAEITNTERVITVSGKP